MCDRDNYRLLGHLSRVVDEGVNSVHREFNADTSGFFRAPRVSRPFQHFLPFKLLQHTQAQFHFKCRCGPDPTDMLRPPDTLVNETSRLLLLSRFLCVLI